MGAKLCTNFSTPGFWWIFKFSGTKYSFPKFLITETEHKSMRSIWSSYSIRWRGSRASIIRVGALSQTNTEWAAHCARSAPPKRLPTERSSVIRYDRLTPRLSAITDRTELYPVYQTQQHNRHPGPYYYLFFPQFLGRYVSTQTHSSCINNGRLRFLLIIQI